MLPLLLACSKPAATPPVPSSTEHLIPGAEEVLVPVGRWMKVGEAAYYTYVDPEAGLSMQGQMPADMVPADAGDDALVFFGQMIVRLTWRGENMVELTDSEREAMGLPEVPDWLDAYGPQLPAGTLYGPWRLDTRLAHRYHPDFPDDLQVAVFDGPELAPPVELVWVRVGSCTADDCTGVVLNQPYQLKTVSQGSTIHFSPNAPPQEPLVMVPGSASR